MPPSHRSGLETCWHYLEADRKGVPPSHRSGLETPSARLIHQRRIEPPSHRSGLETCGTSCARRTTSPAPIAPKWFRNFLGNDIEMLRKRPPSHRSGLETQLALVIVAVVGRPPSHRSGLETDRRRVHARHRYRAPIAPKWFRNLWCTKANRVPRRPPSHRSGLETISETSAGYARPPPPSHRSGLETAVAGNMRIFRFRRFLQPHLSFLIVLLAPFAAFPLRGSPFLFWFA